MCVQVAWTESRLLVEARKAYEMVLLCDNKHQEALAGLELLARLLEESGHDADAAAVRQFQRRLFSVVEPN